MLGCTPQRPVKQHGGSRGSEDAVSRQSWNRSSTLQATQRVVPLVIMLVALLALLATMTGPVGLSGTLASNAGGQGAAGAQSQGNVGATQDQHCDGHNVDDGRRKHEGGGSSVVESDNGDVRVTVSEDGYSVSFSDPDTGEPLTVDFCVKGSTDTASGTGSSWGPDAPEQLFTKSGEQAQISYVVVYRIVVVEPPCPGTDGNIDVSPNESTNPINSSHTKTATVTNGAGAVCPDAVVLFEVSDEGNVTITEETDTSITFTNDTAGVTNTVTACTNPDGTKPGSCDDAGVIKGTATKSWVDTNGPAEEAFCRAVLLHLLGEDIFEANPDRNPCADDDAGPTYLILDALGLTGTDLGGFVFFFEDGRIELTDGETGFISVDAAFSRTRGDKGTAHAESGVAEASLGTEQEQIGASVLTSSHTTEDCDSESSGSAKVVELRLGGEVIGIPGGHTVIDELMPVLYLELEREQPTAQALKAVLLEAIEAAIAFSESGCESAE
jgi:hypothetical protein